MNAIVVQHPNAASFRATHRVATEVRRLQADALWLTLHRDRATGLHRQVTDRKSGTYAATLPPDGETVWWFADTDGDEFGHWVAEPYGGLHTGTSAEPAVPGVEDGYSAGLDIGRSVAATGTSTTPMIVNAIEAQAPPAKI